MQVPNGQGPDHGFQILEEALGPQIRDQQQRVGAAYQAQQVGRHVFRSHRRAVHQLDLDVFEGNHAGLHAGGGEGVVTDLGVRVGQGLQDRGLAAGGRTREDELGGPFPAEPQGWAAAFPAGAVGLRLELGELALEISVQVIRPLVLGQEGDHVFETGDFLVDSGRLAKRLLRLSVLGSDIRRHSLQYTPSVAGGKDLPPGSGRRSRLPRWSPPARVELSGRAEAGGPAATQRLSSAFMVSRIAHRTRSILRRVGSPVVYSRMPRL